MYSPNNNKPPQHITIEDIRKVKGYENISDAHATRLLHTIRQFASLLEHFTTNSSKP